jgi:hypothetical protein
MDLRRSALQRGGWRGRAGGDFGWRLGLSGTELARAQVGTIRLKLLKIGAVIWRNTRRIRFCLSSACPDKDLFAMVAQRLTAG